MKLYILFVMILALTACNHMDPISVIYLDFHDSEARFAYEYPPENRIWYTIEEIASHTRGSKKIKLISIKKLLPEKLDAILLSLKMAGFTVLSVEKPFSSISDSDDRFILLPGIINPNANLNEPKTAAGH